MTAGRGLRQIPLAIVGMACRLPGADGLDSFWQMLSEGRSGVGALPHDRFDRELYYDPRQGVRNKSYTDRGAIVPRLPSDAESPLLPPELARGCDITHRILCNVAADAFRHARLDPFNLAERNTGVYIGHTIGSDRAGDANYARALEETAPTLRELPELQSLVPERRESLIAELIARVRGEYGPGAEDQHDLASHMAAGIVSKTFGLSGPFMAVNAACASSLQALVLAARALQRKQIGMAVVGGASVCSREWLVLFSQARSLTAGESRPFDHRADGLVVAEAYVALVVKTLEQAQSDGDPIQAVIRGLGMSADGKGRSLWAPRSAGQVEAIRRAYGVGIDVADVQYIEAHATATQLGDATEIVSLGKIFEGVFPEGKKIPIASVKANIGHSLEAAGLVGVVKAALCMQKGLIPKAIHVETLNPKVDWAAAPVYVPRETIPWPEPAAGNPRRAAVNAFGIGGLNVHVVLDGSTSPTFEDAPARMPARPRSHQAACDGTADEAVAIIGLGSVFPGANGIAEYEQLLQLGGRPQRPRTKGDRPRGVDGRIDGFQYDWRRHRIPPKEIELADPLQFMVLDAADQALRDAGYDREPFDRRRTGVIVGTEFDGDFNFRLQLALRLPHSQRLLQRVLAESGTPEVQGEAIARAFVDAWHAAWPVLEDNTGSFSASSLAVRISKSWDLMGCAAALDSGPTSGMAALNAAIDLLLAGDCDMMLCAAAQRNFKPSSGTSGQRDAMSSGNSACVPFDRGGSGFVHGEGAAVLLLKRLADAQRDGDTIHGIVRGMSAVHDVSLHAVARSFRTAFDRSGVDANRVALAICDACGLPEVDESLARAVLPARSASNGEALVHLASVIGQIGHLGGASGMASLVAAVLALRSGRAPGIAGLEFPVPTVARNQDLLQCTAEPAPLPEERPGQNSSAAVISHGKGLAYCVIVDQSPVPRETCDSDCRQKARLAASST